MRGARRSRWANMRDKTRASRRQLREFAAALIAFAALAVAARWLRSGSLSATVLASGLAATAVGVIGLVWPPRIAGLFSTITAVTLPIGRVVSEVMLFVLYFAVLTPIALLARLARRNRLHRELDRGAAS